MHRLIGSRTEGRSVLSVCLSNCVQNICLDDSKERKKGGKVEWVPLQSVWVTVCLLIATPSPFCNFPRYQDDHSFWVCAWDGEREREAFCLSPHRSLQYKKAASYSDRNRSMNGQCIRIAGINGFWISWCHLRGANDLSWFIHIFAAHTNISFRY